MVFCFQTRLVTLRFVVVNGNEAAAAAFANTSIYSFPCLQATPPAERPRMGGVPPSPRDPPFAL